MATELRRAAEIRARLEAVNGFKIVSKEVREVREPLTPEQMATIAADMAAAALRANAIEEEKKLVTKQLKDKKDEQDAIVTSLAQTYEKGYEDTETEVFVVADFGAKVRRIFSIKTGLQVQQEVLQDRDLQEELKLKPKAEKPEAGSPAPEEGEAKMADENDVIIMHNPERIALGYEGKGGEDGALEGSDGLQVTEADYEILADEKPAKQEEKTCIVTQIRSVEAKEEKKLWFITTAENKVLFTEDEEAVAVARLNIQQNKAGSENGKSYYVEATYIESATRNKQLCEMKALEVPQTAVDAEAFEPMVLNERTDIEEGDDPDGDEPPHDDAASIEKAGEEDHL